MPKVTEIDHIYIATSDLRRSEAFYDRVFVDVLGFRQNGFTLGSDPHIQYFNRHFGYALRPARASPAHDSYAPGLHHFCLRGDSVSEVVEIAEPLHGLGIAASEAALHSEYAPDYWTTFFMDPDGIRLEVTNYRRDRHDTR